TQEFNDEIGELRAISGHVLRATGIQVPEDDLDDLRSPGSAKNAIPSSVKACPPA
ncbi:hypothetical protein Tco_0249594, partial [Tanacetum coccineum]